MGNESAMELPDAVEPGLYVGIDLGGTNMQIGLVEVSSQDQTRAEVLTRSKLKTLADEGLKGVLGRLERGVREVCQEQGVEPGQLRAVGIGAPAPVDPVGGVVIEAVNLRWNQVPLGRMLAERLSVPAFVDNDVNVALLGEARLGAGIGADPLMGVWIGTGIGGALMFGGDLYYGRFLTAGEIGHMHLLPFAPPGSRTFEHNCSRTALVDRFTRLIRSNRRSMLVDLAKGDLSKIKSKTLGEAYRAGDELVVEVVEHAAGMIGTHIGSIQTLLSLERVVLGGGLTEALGRPFVEQIAKHVRRVAFPETVKRVEVIASALEADAGVLGAVMLAGERLPDVRYHEGAGLVRAG
ncbi:MAG: ROK family protein [Phycisphaeraceae bacterium]|nr:ROK family protein [Phycisphaeraceae bacterium]